MTSPPEPVALFRIWGAFTADQGARAFSGDITRPGFDPAATMLTDARAVTGLPISYRQLAARVARLTGDLARIADGTRSVLLVARQDQFGMARILAQVAGAASPISFHVTRSEAEALTLAGCPDRDIAALAARLAPA